ncbi:FAD:protein FMN transferase [Solimonas sp. K1W22B-7]|uniref:FAD:protein FMN transferase n=1 Tax=Solimonas sp. K1W22B-7 TaxID=2303331 RepID=UPI000E3308F7|nr:FAD:protein FMN transferase [Solimonas sp. K1W22B-7]AXQ31518.1 FAD:protein FMN transferase [Solimonas sp. K1W22B-7]
MRFQHFSFHAMGGPCSLQLFARDEALLQRAAATATVEVHRIEAKYSRYKEDSVLSRINASAGDRAGTDVDPETAALLDYAAAAHEQSDGLFDATSGVLRRAWDFKARKLPQPGQLEALLPLVGWHKLQWRKPRLVLPHKGMELDFGGFGKEYAADRAAGVLAAMGVHHGLIELGGDIRVLGPQPDGSPWRVGIRHPRAPETPVASIELSSGAIASSGDYERYFELAGRRYSHILDPHNGWPIEGLASVSVLAEQCLVAGTATTIAMLKGHKGRDWLEQLGLPWLVVDAGGSVEGSIHSIGVEVS